MINYFINRHRDIVRRGAVGVVPFTNTHSVFYGGGNEYSNVDALLTNSLASNTVGTWEHWIRPVDATPALNEILISFGDTNANENLQLYITTDGKLNIFLRIAGTNKFLISTDAVAFGNNTWALSGIVFDGVLPVLYVNGVAPAQSTIISTDTTVYFNASAGLDNGRIADRIFNNGAEEQHFHGNMDEIRFWNVNRSAAQMLDSYNGGTPKAADTTGLVSEFKIDGDTVPTMVDSFGANNGTYVNVVQNEIQNVTP